MLSGTNLIAALNMSDFPVQDIPIRIDSSLVLVDGKLDINGTTIDVADMYIEGQQVQLDYRGRFSVRELEIGSKKSIKVEFKTVFGNTITKTFAVKNDLNSEPIINAKDLIVKMGDTFNPLTGVTATDEEDRDLTSSIEVIKNTVDTNIAGKYEVTYKVTDSAGAPVTKTNTVTVKDETAPVVTGVKDGVEYKKAVKVYFNEGKATLNGKAIRSGTTISEEGIYELIVKDAAKNVTTVSFKIDKTAPMVTGIKDDSEFK